MKTSGDDRISIRRMISNVKFILTFAFQTDKTAVYAVYASYIIGFMIDAVYEALFIKYFIEILQNKSIKLKETVILIIIGIIIMIFNQTLRILAENWTRVRILRMTGIIQKTFIEKASQIDLVCYDNKEYFDDFVIAASQSEEMIVVGIFSTAKILGKGLGIFTLGILISTINPIITIFPIAGFFINMITRFKITEYEYSYNMQYRRIMRKADYSKRVFYQPEYAKEIKLSNIHVPLKKQFDHAVCEIEGKAKQIGMRIAVLSLINWISTFTILSYYCVPMFLGYLALVKRNIGMGDVVSMNNAQAAMRNNLNGINYAMVQFQEVGQFAEKFRRFINYEINIENRIGDKPVPKKPGLLEIKNMSFRYDGAAHDTLENINMTLKPGEKIAIVGENGAGKTTFVKLLMRLYDVTEGSICYGGEDIRNFTTNEYRNIIGAVFQDYQIYGATLAENVLMDDVSAYQEEKVVEALKMADFEKKLRRLPNGINSNMTKEFKEDGMMLSGGEAQKVAIARMFAKSDRNLAVAILDEPSSALDPIAEYCLYTNMIKGVGDASVIFISHRLSTTRDADCIYMFEHGKIIERGTHKDLMSLNGAYARMFIKQAYYYQDIV